MIGIPQISDLQKKSLFCVELTSPKLFASQYKFFFLSHGHLFFLAFYYIQSIKLMIFICNIHMWCSGFESNFWTMTLFLYEILENFESWKLLDIHDYCSGCFQLFLVTTRRHLCSATLSLTKTKCVFDRVICRPLLTEYLWRPGRFDESVQNVFLNVNIF